MKDYQNVLDYQERLIRNYKYRPLPDMMRAEARAFYAENIPDGLFVDGGNMSLFSRGGMKIADGYNRIVIGDYGAMVELLPEQMVHENIRIKPGEEYRENNPKYSGNVKFAWLTAKDDSDVKIYYQKKEVAYASLVPGRYYVSVFECEPARVLERDVGAPCVTADGIAGWLKEHGVYSDGLADYYFNLVPAYGDVIHCAIQHNVFPGEMELWLCIHDVCQANEGLTYEQYEAVVYNLNVLGCKGSELAGSLDGLAMDVRIAIELGLEGIAIPFEMQKFSPDTVRELLKFSADELLAISRFSKVIAGHKAEATEQVRDVDKVIAEANQRVKEATTRYKEYEHIMG